MTYEEAKMQIQAIPEKIWDQLSEPDREAMEMAFSALQVQEAKTQLSAEGTTSDLISRQAAIDALSHMCSEDENGITVSKSNVNSMLRALPSAQPDGIPLEWIDKHLEWLDNCDNDFAQLAKVGIRAMVEIWKKDKT